MTHLSPAPRFRAWDPETLSWIKPRKVHSRSIPVTHTKVGFQLKSRFVLSQFTGILDCNKREVFDGDIMEGYMATGHGQSARKRLWRFLVAWNTWSHGWHFNTEWDYRWRFFPSFGQCAVVGNLWENPDMVADKVPPIGVPVDVL